MAELMTLKSLNKGERYNLSLLTILKLVLVLSVPDAVSAIKCSDKTSWQIFKDPLCEQKLETTKFSYLFPKKYEETCYDPYVPSIKKIID